MPLRLDIKRKLLARSDRVKSVDLHPTETWLLVGLYNGNVHIWNYESSQLVKSFEVGDLPVRTAKFIARKSWVVVGSDDMMLRIFNYNTQERVHQFEAHSDYIRCVAVHNTQPFVLSSSDDMLIKLWDFESKWTMKQTFEGHTHYVMQIAINPKDNNTFATASLDKTVKVWQFGSQQPNFTLEGHEKGVNCVDYYHGGDKPYLISGADDHTVKIWDYQNKTCVQTLTGHSQNVSAVGFHPELPLIITGSEDSTVRLWHSNTYRLESTLNYGLERVWCVQAQKGTNTIAIGYDEGSVIVKLGRDEPAASMDSSGKIVWAKHSEIQQANLKTIDAEILDAMQDGERISLAVKDMGSSEVFPHTITHSPNGRFVTACGDGEYIVYTALSLRNKDFGSAIEFVWAPDSNLFAIRESATNLKIKKNFKDFKQIRSESVLEGIHAGPLLAARSANNVCFYDWETANLIRRIEIGNPKLVVWNDAGNLVALCAEDSFYILKYDTEAYGNATADEITEDGVESAFDVVGEQAEAVKTGFWVGDCFVYTTTLNRLNYYVGGEIVTIAHVDRPIFLLGYMSKESRIYAIDKDLNVISYKLLLSVLEYQTAVMRRDFDSADRVLGTVPKEQRTRVAHFLEKQGFKRQALAVSQDPDHKFDLAIALGDLKTAFELAQISDAEEKWKQLAHVATAKSEIKLAGECHRKAKDLGALMLLATASGSADMLQKLSKDAAATNLHNVQFLSKLLLGDVDACLDILIASDRLPEAAFFARTHCPSQVTRVIALWKEKADRVSKNSNKKIGESLADPVKYENLFPGFNDSLRAESYLRAVSQIAVPASARAPPVAQRNVQEEIQQAVDNGALSFTDDGRAILHGVESAPRRQPQPAEVEVDVSPLRAAPVPLVPSPRREPTPPPREPTPSPREPTPEPVEEEDEDEIEISAGRAVQPDLVAEKPRPDVVPQDETPDLVHHDHRNQPQIVADAQEGSWSDDDFGDPEGGNDINLDDLNLDDED